MSHLKYYAYDGVGARNKQQFKYSQAVRVGDKIECTGQGTRMEPGTREFYMEINAEIDQAFRNVELNLRDAGGKEALAAMVRKFKQYMPDHEPIWTCAGVASLVEDDMRVEIEVVAHDP
ncbi:Transposable element tc1 [Fusarium oxysporum f. sp. albedinis]|nr:Transposable element tc1 [Fusarium oxysporum f. sp. albedinis]